MHASVRAPVPRVTNYWHTKGTFIRGGDESADVSVTCDDNLIELLVAYGAAPSKKKNTPTHPPNETID